jgi:hypothetical protein
MDTNELAKELNKINVEIPLVKLADLIPNVYYKIVDCYKCINRFGRETVIVTISRNDFIQKCFLPKKYYKYDNLVGLEFCVDGVGVYKGFQYHKILFKEN